MLYFITTKGVQGEAALTGGWTKKIPTLEFNYERDHNFRLRLVDDK